MRGRPAHVGQAYLGVNAFARMVRIAAPLTTRVGTDVSGEVVRRQPSAATDEGHPAATQRASAMAAVEGTAPRFELCPGVLETRWYA